MSASYQFNLPFDNPFRAILRTPISLLEARLRTEQYAVLRLQQDRRWGYVVPTALGLSAGGRPGCEVNYGR